MATPYDNPQGQVPETDPTKPKPKAQPGQLPLAGQAGAMAPVPPTPSPTIAAPNAPVDRVKLATDAFNTFAKSSDPYYQKTLRDATSQAAGGGQLMSGQLRTSLGDAAHQRQLELDTARDTLVNKATEGSIADASTAYQQQLASSQQGLASELGRGNLAVSQGQLQLAKTGQEGSQALAEGALTGSYGGQQTLGAKAQDASQRVAEGQLALAGQQLAQSGNQFSQSLDFQKQQADIDAQFRSGQMTLAQRNQALAELQNQQQFGIAGEQLALAKAGQEQQGEQFSQSLDFQKQQAEIDAQFRAGQLTLAQKNQALAELAQQQNNTIQTGQLELAQSGQAMQGEQFKASLAQQAQQFGLSQTQAMELAKLGDATQNRSIDVSQAQGKQALLVELARIIGGPTGNGDPTMIAAIANQLFGVSVPNTPLALPPPSAVTTSRPPFPDEQLPLAGAA